LQIGFYSSTPLAATTFFLLSHTPLISFPVLAQETLPAASFVKPPAQGPSSPWKSAPSPCSLPSRAPPAAMVEIPFPLLFPCAQRLHHGHRYLCSNHGALISPAAMAPPSAHSLPAPFLPSASNGTTPPAPTLSRGSNSHGRPEFFFQCPFHLPPSSSISLPFLLFPGAAARSPCSDCSHGVQVPAPSPPIQKQQSLRSSISPMVVSPPSGRHRPLCSALHVRRQPICAASNTLGELLAVLRFFVFD
jgi:hypothetical protein